MKEEMKDKFKKIKKGGYIMKKKTINVLLVLMLLILVLSGCTKTKENGTKTNPKNETSQAREYEEPIKNYFDGLNKCDAKMYASAYPKFIQMEESIKDKTLKDRKKNLERTYGDNLKYSYEILSDKELKEYELEKIEDHIKDAYKENVTVKKGYEVKVKEKISGDKDFDEATDFTYVYNIDGDWYIINVSPKDI